MKFLKKFEGKVLTKDEQRKIEGGNICGFGLCLNITSDGVKEWSSLGPVPSAYDPDSQFGKYFV